VISKLGKKALVVLAAAGVVVLASAVAAAFEVIWVAVAGLGLLQVAILALLVRQGSATDATRRIDALGTRLMAAVETERLDAADRHQALLSALDRGSTR
jgi:hypothetical protein